MKVATPQGTPPSPVKVILPLSCYVNLQEKRKTFPLSGTAHRLPHFPLYTQHSMRTSHQ
jgi:hypothetical protein